MIVISCTHETRHKHGKDSNGRQRWKCASCGLTMVDNSAKPLGGLRTTVKQASMALALMMEGMSIRSVQRLTGLCRKTLADMILVVGANCQTLLDNTIANVEVSDVQLDEIWSFCGMKEKTRTLRGKSPVEFGDSWTFYGISENKLILAHQVGQRDSETCWAFLLKMKKAVGKGRFQLTTDGLAAYRQNVPFAFGMQVDFAVLIKNYQSTQEAHRYSPAKITNIEKLPMFGDCDEDRISTSYIERFNLTVRMSLRRFTRLTNGHSKSLKHHVAMQAIFVAYYNFARKNEAIKNQTPAMASKLTDHVWSIKELIERAAAA
jgi:transposase-like protein/IS1 family transposase